MNTGKMKLQILKTVIPLTIVSFLLFSCGNGNGDGNSERQPQTEEQGLTEFELEHGIGPVTERVDIDDEIDPEMVERGRSVYAMKCEACHNMEGRMVGPQLGDVLDYRSPEFVMNFILNPSGMTREHPVGQELLREYMTPMPFQNVTEDEARAVVEYLRDYSAN